MDIGLDISTVMDDDACFVIGVDGIDAVFNGDVLGDATVCIVFVLMCVVPVIVDDKVICVEDANGVFIVVCVVPVTGVSAVICMDDVIGAFVVMRVISVIGVFICVVIGVIGVI